jgi:hypothetical protein
VSSQTIGEVSARGGNSENYGLHAGVLGPLETLAQSVSAMAPSTSPSLTIPLVFALAGNATWFVYLLATAATLLVGFCVSRFARLSASPGSLYTYAADTLPPAFGVIAAWGLLLAYIATGASVAGGALYYTGVLSQQFFHWTPPAIAHTGSGLRRGWAHRVQRCQALGGVDAVDRSGLRQPDPDCARGAGLPLRLSIRSGPVQAERRLNLCAGSGAGAFDVQLCRV